MLERFKLDLSSGCGERAHQGCIGDGHTEFFERDGGRIDGVDLHALRNTGIEVGLLGVDDSDPTRFHTVEDVDVTDQGRILHDDVIGFVDLAAQPYLLVAEPDERLNRGAPAFHTKGRECLGKDTALECCVSNEFGGGHRTLTTPAVNA